MNKYHNTFKTDLNCPLQRDIFNNMNEQQKRFFGYTDNHQLQQINTDTKSIKTTKTKSSNRSSNKSSNKSSNLIPSYELQMKAAGYILAASNASKREAKIKKL